MEEHLLYTHYSDDENRDMTYKALLKSTRKHLMQPSSRAETLFLIDIDNEEGKDVQGNALKKISELGLTVYHQRRTKNGWHMVVNPFNPNLWPSEAGEIKKDGLLCIKY